MGGFSIPTQNSHRTLHFMPDLRAADAMRLPDIAADALKSARGLLTLRDGLGTDAAKVCKPMLDILERHVAARNLLNDHARSALGDLVYELEHLLACEGRDSVASTILYEANTALNASHRVADLISAAAAIAELKLAAA